MKNKRKALALYREMEQLYLAKVENNFSFQIDLNSLLQKIEFLL